MSLEEVLVRLGGRPLAMSPYSHAVIAIVNAQVNDPAKQLTPESTGSAVLTMLYHLPDQTIKNQLLTKSLEAVRDKDYYKVTVLWAAALITLIAIAIVVAMLTGQGSTEGNTTLLGKIIDNVFQLIRLLLGLEKSMPPL